jgi:hypothetical protein
MEKKKPNYIRFWAYIAARLYIKNMMKEDRYEMDDLKTYDVKADLREKEIALDITDTLTEFYNLYDEDKKVEEIDVIVAKYKTWYSVLLQRLYRKYIHHNFEVDEDKDSYPDIVILG